MNNQETLAKIKQLFKDLDNLKLAKNSMRFFGEGGGTEVLKQNTDVLLGMADASCIKALADMQAGQVNINHLPTYTAMLGVASGLTLGVYLMAEAFGLTEQILDGSSMTETQVSERLERGLAEHKTQPDLRQELFEKFKVDNSMN